MPIWTDYPSQTTPDDADTLLAHDVSETVVGDKMKRTTWANIKAALKTYMDTLYKPVSEANGWTPVTGTFSYASASTITISAGGAAVYVVGDRLKWVTATGSTQRYGVVTVVANTLLTVAVNTTHVLVNEAWTLPFYSHQISPVGFPQWFALPAPTFDLATYDNGAGAQPTTSEHRFCINGRTLTTHYRGSGVKVATNNGFGFAMSVYPAVPANSTDQSCFGSVWVSWTTNMVGAVFSNGTNLLIRCQGNITDNAAIDQLSWTITYEI